MEKAIKEIQSRLEQTAIELCEATGAKCVNFDLRISPYEITQKIGLEFYESKNRDCCKVPGCGPGCKDD